MRQKISLYIAGKLVDLNDQSFVLFNYTTEDLSNPAIVKNSFSQQISLEGTPNNDRIFASCFRLDATTGIFNPLRKVPFSIYNENSEILEAGYIKLDGIQVERNRRTYQVSLYGGLGEFFYHLSFATDGTKKTLADLVYEYDAQGQITTFNPKINHFSWNASYVRNAWTELGNGDNLGMLINFAPAYNGIPTKGFDANKAIYSTIGLSVFNNIPNNVDGYTPKDGEDGYMLLQMTNGHTEWQMQDLRAYQQRMVISLKGLLHAFTMSQNSGRYTFLLDPEVFSSSNKWYNEGWMTLPMYDRSKGTPNNIPYSTILGATDTPANYLIGLAKMFGLVFLQDAATKTITLTSRDRFYNGEVIDLSSRITPEKGVNPFPMDAKYYIWGNPTIGAFATEYENKYGREYGSQWVNTGYDYNADQKKVLDGVPFKGAADVLESDGLYQVYEGREGDQGEWQRYNFKVAYSESVKYNLYSGDLIKSVDIQPAQYPNGFPYGGIEGTYKDLFPKVQLHGDENKEEDGANVLLYFNGFIDIPRPTSPRLPFVLDAGRLYFHLSSDTDKMLELNDGVPCWNVTMGASGTIQLASLPVFRRWYVQSSIEEESMEMGDPLEIAVEDNQTPGSAIYPRRWQKYISDRYDKDTRVVTRKVNLSGMMVNASLLRNFYWFEGGIWILNKIINHSLTTYDLTECEFVKVQNKDNYLNGQM